MLKTSSVVSSPNRQKRKIAPGACSPRVRHQTMTKWSNHGVHDLRSGRPISQREIALLLDPYDIHPTYIHRGRKTERGYRVEHFAEAFRHYLPEVRTRKRVTVRKKHDRHGRRRR